MAGKLVLALAMLVAQAAAFAPTIAFAPARVTDARQKVVTMGGKENELRTRIASVSNTQKITTAMRLVAAAKVRRAQQGEFLARRWLL